MTRVIVHIDKLILRGVDRADAAAVSAQIQTQLQRSFAAPGTADVIASTGDRRRIVVPQSRSDQTHSGVAIGDAIARGIVNRGKP